MKSTIEMARDAWAKAGEGWVDQHWYADREKAFKEFEALVRADERNKVWSQKHWTEYEQAIVAAERERCNSECFKAPVQEPVAWMCHPFGDSEVEYGPHQQCENCMPLYTTPPAAQRQWVGLDWLPKHKCGLHLSHNEHRDVYETVEQFYDADDFISEEEWYKAVAEDSVWVLHWYPNTPVGFTRIAASTLEAIEAKLKEKNT